VVLAHPLVIPDLPGWEQTGQRILALVQRGARSRRAAAATRPSRRPPRWPGTRRWARRPQATARTWRQRLFQACEAGRQRAADRATRAGYRWKLIGENIASGQRTPEEAVASWLDSPGHCANLMNPRFTEMGAAYAVNPQNDNRTAFWTQVFGAPALMRFFLS
jgi:hypothetical protein